MENLHTLREESVTVLQVLKVLEFQDPLQLCLLNLDVGLVNPDYAPILDP